MEKTFSLFLAILTLGFAQQILAQDENASADDSERWSDFLPLNKELAGDADLPLPFGIGITGYWQEQDLKAKSIGLDLDLQGLATGLGTAITGWTTAGDITGPQAAELAAMLPGTSLNLSYCRQSRK